MWLCTEKVGTDIFAANQRDVDWSSPVASLEQILVVNIVAIDLRYVLSLPLLFFSPTIIFYSSASFLSTSIGT